MARVCPITGKRTRVGNYRSHSMRATKRKFYPNMIYKNIRDPITGMKLRVRISAAGLRTLKKKGII